MSFVKEKRKRKIHQELPVLNHSNSTQPAIDRYIQKKPNGEWKKNIQESRPAPCMKTKKKEK